MNDSPTPDSSQFETPALGHSVIPEWITTCSYQQQSVLLLALRGPDGVRKHHPAKAVHTAYRGTMLRAAERGRFLRWGEEADSFMSLHLMADMELWETAINAFFAHVDELPHHYVAHLAHAAQIIGHRHPEKRCREAWGYFYYRWCNDLHVELEGETLMNTRLDDWGKAAQRLSDRQIFYSVRGPQPKPRLLPEIYPGIATALFAITLDNGGLNRDRPTDKINDEMHDWLAKFPRTFLDVFEPWLAALDENGIEQMTAGEETEREEFMAANNVPPLLDEFLTKWFDEVC